MRHFLAISVLIGLLTPLFPILAKDTSFIDPNFLLSDQDLTDTKSVSYNDLAALFAHGALATMQVPDQNGFLRSPIDIVWDAARAFRLNPGFLAVLLQREQSLIEDAAPSQDQLDWAMGYAVCDDCRKDDPGIQKFRGFGAQVYMAAERIRESFLDGLTRTGRTPSGISVGKPVTIDGITVTPQTKATAVLYTYTPHLHGNQVFTKLWNRWFVPDYPSGSLLQDTATGTVWLIQNGTRRSMTRSAFATRFVGRTPIKVTSTVLEAFDEGPAIKYPNYSLVRIPSGTVYLLVDDARRGFASAAAFRATGFSPDEITDIAADSLVGYVEGIPITDGTVSTRAALLQAPTGGVFAVQDGIKHPIISRELLKARFGTTRPKASSQKILDAITTGNPIDFPDGTLVMGNGNPSVYVIADGQRLPIMDEATFSAYGWLWKQVIKTDDRSLALHPLGEPVLRPGIGPTDATIVESAILP